MMMTTSVREKEDPWQPRKEFSEIVFTNRKLEIFPDYLEVRHLSRAVVKNRSPSSSITPQDLENYDALVDVRCYELVGLFLCSLFVPRCGPTGMSVPPCRSLCYGELVSIVHIHFPTELLIPQTRDNAPLRLLL